MSGKGTVWITGAGSGIGRALSLIYAQKGWNVILSGRKEAPLKEVAELCLAKGVRVLVAPFDLSDVNSISKAFDLAISQFEKIDILINNGGVSQRSLIKNTPLSVDREIFETNYFGTIAFTKMVLPWMVKTGGGSIAAVSSIAGLFGFPLRSSYSASKHALCGFFETLGLEHIKDGITTNLIFPGRIQTNLSLSALTESGQTQNLMDDGLADGMPADACAKVIFKGIERKKRRILVGRKELLMVYIHKYLPSLFWYIAPRIKAR